MCVKELLFHKKINNVNCDFQIYAADTRMKISLKILKLSRPRVGCFNSFQNKVSINYAIYYQFNMYIFIYLHWMNIKMEIFSG